MSIKIDINLNALKIVVESLTAKHVQIRCLKYDNER